MAGNHVLDHPDSSARLRAALLVGSAADPGSLTELVNRCAVEPDFFVRDMLTWALTRLPAADTVPFLVSELGSEVAQARSQALHTLSKIGDRSVWPSVARLLTDPDDEVARSAWRAAAVLVPDAERARTAEVLAAQFGRGDADTRLSLSRALLALGESGETVARAAIESRDPIVSEHAADTMRLLSDPDSGASSALHSARRAAALGAERMRAADEGREL
ncbi:HEAT repeat domain-containing protein [Tsukamurella strandjordii]|uniref:HEAT repeat domain-containing protein n=1 Tax=Tsukamurella strandjordii TaxID=147577 RepID=UPI0031DEE9CB